MEIIKTDCSKGFSIFNIIDIYLIKRDKSKIGIGFNYNIQLVLEINIFRYTMAIFWNQLDLPLNSQWNQKFNITL